MKLKVLLFLLSLFYCIDYIAANANKENHNNNNVAANLNGELLPQRRHHGFNNQATRNVREADDRCHPEALENLNIYALAKAANLSENCSEVAAEVFLRLFASDLIEISNTDSDSFEVYKYFGHLITKISVRFERKKESCRPNEVVKFRELLYAVNEKNIDLLTEIAIHYSSDCYVDIFGYLKGPFEKVETVEIEFKNMVVQTGNVHLNEMFPNVRELDLDYDIVTDPNFVNGEYKNLNQLGIAGRLLDASEEKTLTDLLKQNPHIQTILLEKPTYRIFRLVKEYLTNLEGLYIHKSFEEDSFHDEITFESIKKLGILLVHKCTPPKRMNFNPDLEELQFYCSYSAIGDDYFAFILKFPQITKLGAGSEFNRQNFMKLIGLFPKLSEANFDLRNDVTADDIVQFVKRSSQLNKLEFLYLSISNADEFENQLKSHIGEDFEIELERSVAGNVKFLVERKKPIGSGGVKVLASNAFILLAVLFINRLLFF